WDFIATREALDTRTAEVFGWIAAGELDVRIAARLPLAEAAEAHRLLQGRSLAGKILLVP
ncbi:MAG: zinc-binding dehydrogenase, partial [Acidimicrobiaceae bacterium]|nr:zinc-binding dehydrogenase [Acidimicrobiaceae bacterium]